MVSISAHYKFSCKTEKRNNLTCGNETYVRDLIAFQPTHTSNILISIIKKSQETVTNNNTNNIIIIGSFSKA
ncbi:hypothetical protein HanXRQr2_Chr14g0635101 [Helianthus annuus]|uniref:Uncharacterized protein n=1 Tax=Helianthus annuus TaxID=4232 RepID=A0A9K3E8V5_HELAN|nr:hypothetical protein HanXRQr2_Chr14g0635101 [Helianthus annuus]KAJ0839623.1 hypothetical protein HanPSC8_Chr14g0609061 [Helianthus annuus]